MRANGAVMAGLAALVAVAWLAPAAPAVEDENQSTARPGEFLVAAPGMNDPRFYHAVILIVQHDRGGAFGLIVNRPVEDEPLAKLLQELGQKTDGASGKIAIYAGGPVEADIGFVLHSAEYKQPETMTIDKELAVTSSPAVLRHRHPARAEEIHLRFRLCRLGAGPARERAGPSRVVHRARRREAAVRRRPGEALAGRARPARAGALSRTIFAFGAAFFLAALRAGAFAAALRGARQSRSVAIRAPATRASSFAHMMLGWTRRMNGP